MEIENCFRCEKEHSHENAASHKVVTVFFFDGTDEDFVKDFTFQKILNPSLMSVVAVAFVMAEGPSVCENCMECFKDEVLSTPKDKRRYIRNMYAQFIRQMGENLPIDAIPNESTGQVLIVSSEELEAVKVHVSRLTNGNPEILTQGLKAFDKDMLKALIDKMHCGDAECKECTLNQVATLMILEKLSSKPQEMCNFLNGLAKKLRADNDTSGVTPDGKLDLSSVISSELPEDIDYDDLFRKPGEKRADKDRLYRPRIE